ncbi:MAG: hypothetical protein MJZ64_06700 [Paludibacteraceae bacterium]|nr:hypothetical protein [Paludibacteraceae bacterium]
MTIRFAIVLVINLYVTRAVLDVLGVVDFGVYNVVCGFVSLFSFLNISMTNGIQRFYNVELGKQDSLGVRRVYNAALLIQVLLIIVVITALELIGHWYIANKLVVPPERLTAAQWIFQLAVFSFIFVIIQVPYSSIIMAKEKMDYFALVSVTDAVLKLLIVIGLPFLSGDLLIWYGILLAGVSVLNFFMYFIYAKIHFEEIKLFPSLVKDKFLSIISFSGWNIFGSFSFLMREQGIDVLMNLFFGPVVNAARGIANQVNGAFTSLVSNMTTAIRPQMIQSYASGEVRRSLRLMETISKLSCSTIYLVALPIMLEISFILQLWLKGNVPDHTSTFLVIIIFISIINNLNAAVSAIIHASGQMMTYQIVTSIISLTSIPIAYLLLRYGWAPESALICVFLFVSISQIASLFILRHIVPEFSISRYLRSVILPLLLLALITCPILFGVRQCMSEGWLRLVIIIISAAIVVIPAVYWVVLNGDEKKMCRTLLTKFIHRT